MSATLHLLETFSEHWLQTDTARFYASSSHLLTLALRWTMDLSSLNLTVVSAQPGTRCGSVVIHPRTYIEDREIVELAEVFTACEHRYVEEASHAAGVQKF